jgi:signal peptidase I
VNAGPHATTAFTDWIAAGNRAWLVVRGNSMRPWLPPGSRVLVGPARAADVRPGDVIVYRDEGALICHRTLARSRKAPSTFEVKGDAWGVPATTVAADRIVGRVTAVERRGRQRVVRTGLGHGETLVALGIARLDARFVVLRRRWRRLTHRWA